MTALYFHILRPEDRVAVKPHASPIFHAIQYLMGNQSREKLENFRGYGGAQSYPSRTKDIDDVDFSTGSVGLGVGITAFASMMQDFIAAKNWSAARDTGRMIALVGDAEMDEGNIFECLQEGWKHDLRNTWWIIDYNRQSLDGVVQEGLWARIEAIFEAFGWDIVRLKYGRLQQAAFAEPGGEALRGWIDSCPNQLYSALTYQGGAAWRARLMDDIGDQGDVTALLDARSDSELATLMADLGGHCLASLTEAFDAIDHDRPTLFLAYTVKGWGTPLAGHTHVSDQFGPFATQNIPATVSEAPYILDGLLMNEAGRKITEQYADTGGFTDHVFAVTSLLGFRFIPRIRDLPSRRLHLFDPASAPDELRGLIGGKIREGLIVQNWPGVLRSAATMVTGVMPPSQLLKKFAAYPRQHELAVALREIGRVERTLFIIEWLLDADMQRRAQIGLNKGEAHHALKNALRIGRQGEIRDRTAEGQHYRMAGLNLLAAIIIYWNTKHLGQAVAARQRAGLNCDPALLAHISPLGWAHILLTGEYRWRRKSTARL